MPFKRLLALVVLLSSLSAPAVADQVPVSASIAVSSSRLTVGEQAEVRVTISLADGWHINSANPAQDFLIPTRLDFKTPTGVKVTGIEYPEPQFEHMRRFGGREVALYEGRIVIIAKLDYARIALEPGEAVAMLGYQACNETLCLRPALLRMPVGLKFSSVGPVVYAGLNEDLADNIAGIVAGGLWVLIPGMLLLGLALNLTPCVYPLISVTVAYFGGQADSSRGRKLWLALCYMTGIAVTFSVLGVSAALSGGFFGEAMTKPAVLVAVAGVMVALALSSFGFYQLRVPAALGSRLGRAWGGPLGALSMGMTMGVVAAPCVGPVVVGLLVFVGSSGDALLGLSLFFLMAIGLGIPYVGLAMAAGSLSSLPKAGDWLEWIEHLFGCVLLAMAIYFVGPLLSATMDRLVMPVFIAISAVYLAFLDPAGSKLKAFRISRQIVGGIVLGLLAMAHIPVEGHTRALVWEEFSTLAYDNARESGAPFVIEFGADWCLPCKEMEERTFTDAEVLELGRGMSFIEVDMTTTDSYTERVLVSFDVLGAPTTIFFNAEGREFARRIGFIGPEDFAGLLRESGAAGG